MELPKFELPRLPGQEKRTKLFPPTLPKTRVPTPFGTVYLPEYKIGLPKLPPFDEKSRAAMKHAVAIDLSMLPGMIPVLGDLVADVVEDLHTAELNKVLTSEEFYEFLKQDKVAPATIAMVRTLTKGG